VNIEAIDAGVCPVEKKIVEILHSGSIGCFTVHCLVEDPMQCHNIELGMRANDDRGNDSKSAAPTPTKSPE
jgi:hypothetical protein